MTTAVECPYIIDRFIELYGDRRGKIGDGIHGGLAWIGNTRLVLLGGNRQSLSQPSDWRRFSRLAGLAQQLGRPVLLWNLCFSTEAIVQHSPSLVVHQTFQDTQLQLLKLVHPIIGVFDIHADEVSQESDFAAFDGVVLVESNNSLLGSERSFSSHIKIAHCQGETKVKILHLLDQISVIATDVLVSNRIQRIQRITFSNGLRNEARKDTDL